MPFTPSSALISPLRILFLRVTSLIKRRTHISVAWVLFFIFDVTVHASQPRAIGCNIVLYTVTLQSFNTYLFFSNGYSKPSLNHID